jgi:RNA polymerase sigma-70 factor (ECF subfamily)
VESAVTLNAQPQTRAEDFAAAVGPHYAGLVRRLTIVVADQEAGRDLAQDAYLRAFQAWDRFDGQDARAWLHTIGLRLAFNERRRRLRFTALFGRRTEEEPWVDAVDPELGDALQHLRPEHRAALLLSAVDGYTQAEIAEMLGVPDGTVASWLSRTKAQLRKALTDD